MFLSAKRRLIFAYGLTVYNHQCDHPATVATSVRAEFQGSTIGNPPQVLPARVSMTQKAVEIEMAAKEKYGKECAP